MGFGNAIVNDLPGHREVLGGAALQPEVPRIVARFDGHEAMLDHEPEEFGFIDSSRSR